MAGHRQLFARWQDGKGSHVGSYDILECGDAYIELVENYPCADRNELNRREGIVIRETDNCCNRIIAGRTRSEYRVDNAEKINAKNKKYYAANAARMKTKYQCPCGGKYTASGKSGHRMTKLHKRYLDEQNAVKAVEA